MCQLARCCCCCTLRTGSLVLGILGLIGSLSDIGWAVVKHLKYQNENGGSEGLIVTLYGWRAHLLYFTSTRLAIELCFMLLHVTIICLMIHGARKGSPRLILPWLIFGMLGILSLVAFGIMQMIGLEGTSEKAIFGCTTAVAALIMIYFWSVVLSLYKQLKLAVSVQRPEEAYELNK